MFRLKYLQHLVSFFLLLSLFASCDKDREEIIPNISFQSEIYNFTTAPQYNQKNPQVIRYDTRGNTIGLYGVVVYKVSTDIIYAFDLMCPHEKSGASLAEIQSDDNCMCPNCESKFSVMVPYGALLEGPSKYALKPYRAEMDGSTLIIAN